MNSESEQKPLSTKQNGLADSVSNLVSVTKTVKDSKKTKSSIEGDTKVCCETLLSTTVRTLEAALAVSKVDLDVWEVERWLCNKWDCVAKLEVSGGGETLTATELWQVKVWFRRKAPVNIAISSLLKELRGLSPQVKKIKAPKFKEGSRRRALELCIMDPHYGMQCYPPGSDHAWSLADCEEIYMWALNGLLERAKQYAPFEEIIIPFGNDFMHVDNDMHTTTRGTPQPEGLVHSHVFGRAVKLMVRAAEHIQEYALAHGRPVKIIFKVIRGNHDEFSTCALGHVLAAYFHNDENIEVDNSDSPYKFYRFGTNLIGYDHGHSVAQVRLAAVMANEVPQLWAETSYREWHCGDQHRKGSSKPTMFEEQGVSCEYLQALTPPNSWHRRKSFNWQKRGAVSYIWDHDEGPVARLQINMNSYTGKPTGASRNDGSRFS